MKAFISNLGCKLNQAEVEQWARRLVVDGHQIVDRIEEAEVHLVNTCTVTHRAARDSRKVARRARRATRSHLFRCRLFGCPSVGPARR
jgi:threonylcarbamoyladenosine tRNA methylthiotransferase MtaB